MANHPSRSRLTVYPLDAWARRMTSKHEGDGIAVWWFDPQFWTRMPPGFEHVGYAERGTSSHGDYDRGALVRNQSSGIYCLYTGKATIQLEQRKVLAALDQKRRYS